MTTKPTTEASNRRESVRRYGDLDLKRQNNRFHQLIKVGQLITSEINFDRLFELIIAQTNTIMDTERCSIFLIDKENEYLKNFAATDIKRDEIRIKKGAGVAGWVFMHKRSLMINNPYHDDRFYQHVDRATGFRTKCILCVPLINRKDECIGTLQVLNKKGAGFVDEAREWLSYLASFVTIALENAILYEEIKASDTTKQKVIDHLSHELRTPLAVLGGVFQRLCEELPPSDHPRLSRAVRRGKRNLQRLRSIQEKVDDIILWGRPETSGQHCIDMISNLMDLVEALGETEEGTQRRAFDRISAQLRSIVSPPGLEMETVQLDRLLLQIRDQAFRRARHRRLTIYSYLEPNLLVHLDRGILSKVFEGILKNAIENTPDGGLIEVVAVAKEETAAIVFRDRGVGIRVEHRRNIFGGFFHTQNTEMYASKTPYQFNAGGSGTDLLRIKVLAERFGFSIDLDSRRCKFLPGEGDQCPGSIAACKKAASIQECRRSGGSSFSLTFKIMRKPHAP